MQQAVAAAVEAGYRLIDTASAYKNEDSVGRAVASCGIPREELFITTKVWNTAQRIGDIEGAFARSLDRLGLDYVDLYLIHWPVPAATRLPGENWKSSANPAWPVPSASAILKFRIWSSCFRFPALYRP